MKKILSLLAAMLCCTSLLYADELSDTISVDRVFVDSPSKALNVIARSTRMDMLDYAKAGSDYKAVNEFYGVSTIKSISDSCISVDLTQVTNARIFTLPTAKGGIAAIIYTVDTNGAADSQIEFYDGNLRPLKLTNFFKPPVLDSFIRPKYRKDKSVVNQLNTVIPFIALKYEYEPESSTLTATLSLKELVTQEDYKQVAGYLYPSLSYRWTGKKWELK
ncbi:MAG: DUF3256 family protein [Muribaculaceae bacterium]|nr:DUF3256 family protein [Muribaculaceae bacterium]